MTDLDKAQDIRRRLQGVTHDFFYQNFTAVVMAIKKVTGQEVSLRSVQAWHMEPGKRSYRKMPYWALKALEEYVANPDNKSEADFHKENHKIRSSSGGPQLSRRVHVTESVELATREIEQEEASQQKLTEHFGVHGGNVLNEEFALLRKKYETLSSMFHALKATIDNSNDFDEAKSQLKERLEDHFLAENSIRSSKNAIRQNSDEFSNSEGLPPAPRDKV